MRHFINIITEAQEERSGYFMAFPYTPATDGKAKQQGESFTVNERDSSGMSPHLTQSEALKKASVKVKEMGFTHVSLTHGGYKVYDGPAS